MSTSQNNWPALITREKIHNWVIPARNGKIVLPLRNGSAGTVLSFVALKIAEIAKVDLDFKADDWGYAMRPIRGYSTTLSNHASGTAMDLNATDHPLGATNTWTKEQRDKIQHILDDPILENCIRWGANYHGRKDEMHIEIVKDLPTLERVAKRVIRRWRGVRIMAANKGQRAVIYS